MPGNAISGQALSLDDRAPRLFVQAGIACRDSVESAGFGLRGESAVVVVRTSDGVLRDLDWVPESDLEVEAVYLDSEDGRKVMRHSLAHIMAQAVQILFPDSKLGIGPPIENGFYYDFLTSETFSPDDVQRIEQQMRRIIKRGQFFRRRKFDSLDQAKSELQSEPLKLEILASLEDRGRVLDDLSIYDNIEINSGVVAWSDLCQGPHLPSTQVIGAFKLTRIAGAYWRNSENNVQLQRIYGTGWESKEALDSYVAFLKDAESRDHRRIGKELEYFHFEPTAPGMPYWLPKGLRILNSLIEFWRKEHELYGYQEVSTPLVNHQSLWERSGHWEHYKNDMFIIEEDDPEKAERAQFAIKPMNCPNAMVIFNVKTRSYRDLPLRFSDCDPLHRNEKSGALHGLFRVQKFQQDDAHIFISEEMIGEECDRIFAICDRFYGIFGLEYSLRLGTRPANFIGDLETWNLAERNLASILEDRADGSFAIEEGGGAFYGPKIDILMKDVLGREWQMGTIQLDFQLPRRFDCQYIDANGARRTPVVIHRVIYGSLERFIGILLEHTAGALPVWLAPVTAVVIPVASEFLDYADTVARELRGVGARIEVDSRDESLNSKIRTAQTTKIPFTVVVGAMEVEARGVAVRIRGQRDSVQLPLSALSLALASALDEKSQSVDLKEWA